MSPTTSIPAAACPTAGHTYHIKVSVRDAAGNQTVIEQPAANVGGGFLAGTATIQTAPQAQIVERPCTVKPPATGQTSATVECVDVPVEFSSPTVRLSGSFAAGKVPMKLAVPLAGVTIRYGVAGALSQSDTSVKNTSATNDTAALGVEYRTTPADYSGPTSQSVIPKITATIPAAFDTASVVMASTGASVSFAGCPDMTSTTDIICTPDHIDSAVGVVRELHLHSGFRWDPQAQDYVADPVTISSRDTDRDGNILGTRTMTASAGSADSGFTDGSCESAKPSVVQANKPYVHTGAPSNDVNPLTFAWAFYSFHKDDAKRFNDALQDMTDVCYTGWHNPGQDWRMTLSGSTVAINVANAVLIGSGGGHGQTKNPTWGSVEMQFASGPVTIKANLAQGEVSQVRHEPGPGPSELENQWGGTNPSQMHSAWWQYKCSGFTFACRWKWEGSTNAQGNVGHGVFRLDRNWYSEAEPPYAAFNTYVKVHCDATTLPGDDCWNSNRQYVPQP